MELKNKLDINKSSIYKITQNGKADFIGSYIPPSKINVNTSFNGIILNNRNAKEYYLNQNP